MRGAVEIVDYKVRGDGKIDLEIRVRWWSLGGLAFWRECYLATCAQRDVSGWHPVAMALFVICFPGWRDVF